MNDYSTKSIRQSKRKTMMTYLTLKQKVEVMTELNEVALVLLEFYLSKTGVDNYEYNDEQVSVALNWDISKVRRYRLMLIRFKCFRQTITKNSSDVHTHTVIGERWI